jgi:hypothetical protein
MGCEQSAFGHVGIIVPDMKKGGGFLSNLFWISSGKED